MFGLIFFSSMCIWRTPINNEWHSCELVPVERCKLEAGPGRVLSHIHIVYKLNDAFWMYLHAFAAYVIYRHYALLLIALHYNSMITKKYYTISVHWMPHCWHVCIVTEKLMWRIPFRWKKRGEEKILLSCKIVSSTTPQEGEFLFALCDISLLENFNVLQMKLLSRLMNRSPAFLIQLITNVIHL